MIFDIIELEDVLIFREAVDSVGPAGYPAGAVADAYSFEFKARHHGPWLTCADGYENALRWQKNAPSQPKADSADTFCTQLNSTPPSTI